MNVKGSINQVTETERKEKEAEIEPGWNLILILRMRMELEGAHPMLCLLPAACCLFLCLGRERQRNATQRVKSITNPQRLTHNPLPQRHPYGYARDCNQTARFTCRIWQTT